MFQLLDLLAAYLLECLVVDKTGRILGNLELSFLDLLAKLPEQWLVVSWPTLCREWSICRSTTFLTFGFTYIVGFGARGALEGYD